MLFGIVNERSMVKYFVQFPEIENILRLWRLMPFGLMDTSATQKHAFEKAWRMTEGPDSGGATWQKGGGEGIAPFIFFNYFLYKNKIGSTNNMV
jgi:hypothetical protein